ncbi:MAG: septum site-determining protein MinC [Cyanobacteriota bacterium]|nr:septum site-determining protein MinC [Cyanobacteriota bacterium]
MTTDSSASSESIAPQEPSLEAQSPEEETPDAAEVEPVGTLDRHLQVRFKSDGERLLLLLPPQANEGDSAGELTWTELSQQLQHRLNGGDRFWQPNMPVHLMAVDRLLDVRQLQEIAEILNREQLQLDRVSTCRRQTAVAAATAGYSVEQQSRQETLHQAAQNKATALAEPLYLQTTVRSGVEIRHPGTIVIIGDINPGGAAIADGDILVWGRLRGLAHAGAAGNSGCMIMALQMEPTQLRIADAVARAPANPPSQYYPEAAYATPQGIRITRASDFSKTLMSLGPK